MTTSTAKSVTQSAYYEGLRRGFPFLLVLIPFAMLFGVFAADAGLQLAQILGFSFLVIAGAAQFAALQMMVDNAAITIVLLTALAVNLRMAMYSAALVPHVGGAPFWQRALVSYLIFDQTYAISVAEFEDSPDRPLADKVAFFLGVATPIVPAWVAVTLVGALLGSAIPPSWALDFALPITFIALVAPMIKTLAHLAAALVSIVAGLSFAGLPSGSGLLLAAALAMLTGALVEMWQERRA